MSKRAWAIAAGVAVAIVGVVVLYDVLVETDEERLERFVADVTGTISAERVDAARGRWVDLSRQPIEVSVYGQTLAYRSGDDEALANEAHERLRSFYGSSARAMSSAIAVEGDRATITLRLIGDRLGMANAEWTLERHGEEWLVSRVAVRR